MGIKPLSELCLNTLSLASESTVNGKNVTSEVSQSWSGVGSKI